jgi:hypothetical protein
MARYLIPCPPHIGHVLIYFLKPLVLSSMNMLMSYIRAFLAAYETHIIIVGLIASVIALIEYFSHGVTRLVSWLRNVWRRLNRLPTIPSKTMSIVTPARRLSWLPVMSSGQPATQFSGLWYVTSITDGPVFLLEAYIKSPGKARTVADIRQPHQSPLQLGIPNEIRLTFYPCPPIHRQGKVIKATVVFVNQYRNKHIKNVVLLPPVGS